MFKPRLLTEKCRQLSFWARNSGNEKMLTGRRQPVGPDEGERGGEKWPLDKDYQGQVCLVQGYIWCVLIRVQRALVWIDQASYHQVSEHPGGEPAQPLVRPHHQRLWSRRVWTHRPVTEVVVKGADVPPMWTAFHNLQVPRGPKLPEVYQRFKSHASTGQQRKIAWLHVSEQIEGEVGGYVWLFRSLNVLLFFIHQYGH